MDDRPLRAALGRLGDTPQPPSAVDLDLARAQGRKRMRWRRAGLVEGPALAAALVTALAAAGVFGRIGTHGGLPSAHASKIKGILIGVSCPVPSRCVAVGEYYKPGPRYALIEQWNGIRWAISKGPVPPGPYRGDLYGISCVNAADCTAVGASVGNPPQPTATPIRDRALIEHWNGSAWTIMASPVLPASGSLGEISCTGPSRCIAVGMTGGGTAQQTRTLVERRNGSRWVIVPSPNPAGAAYSSLSSVSCTGPVNCMAVGEYFPGGQEQDRNHILVEHWNGSAWTITDAGPPPAGSLTSYLSAVSCTAESDCVAVGTASYPHRKGGSWGGSRERTLIEHWNGSAWSIHRRGLHRRRVGGTARPGRRHRRRPDPDRALERLGLVRREQPGVLREQRPEPGRLPSHRGLHRRRRLRGPGQPARSPGPDRALERVRLVNSATACPAGLSLAPCGRPRARQCRSGEARSCVQAAGGCPASYRFESRTSVTNDGRRISVRSGRSTGNADEAMSMPSSPAARTVCAPKAVPAGPARAYPMGCPASEASRTMDVTRTSTCGGMTVCIAVGKSTACTPAASPDNAVTTATMAKGRAQAQCQRFCGHHRNQAGDDQGRPGRRPDPSSASCDGTSRSRRRGLAARAGTSCGLGRQHVRPAQGSRSACGAGPRC